MKETLLEEILIFLLLEFVLLSVLAIRGLRLLYNISSISYVFCIKHFTASVERQISKDKVTHLLAVKLKPFY